VLDARALVSLVVFGFCDCRILFEFATEAMSTEPDALAIAQSNRRELVSIVNYLNGRLKEAFDGLKQRIDDLEERLTEIEMAGKSNVNDVKFDLYPSDEDE